MIEWLNSLTPVAASWLTIAGQALIVLLVALVLSQIVASLLSRIAGAHPLSTSLFQYCRGPIGWVIALLALQVILRSSSDSLTGLTVLRHLNSLGIIGALTWSALRCVTAVAKAVIELHPSDIENNLGARRIHTQTKVLARSLMVLLVLIGISAALMTFPSVRQFGAGLMASAGVAGLIVGFAAKPVIGNLLAGIQIAITQPIRLDDVVIVEGEWGWIEEISGTYVVVRLWDQRRLVVPLQWFIEHPFQNWTRTTSEILGSVFIWLDFGVPIEPLRSEARRICEAAPEWDGRVCLIQVTDANERAMQLRVLVSAIDSPACWDLRCKVREHLVAYVNREFPRFLPKMRGAVVDRGSLSPGSPGDFACNS